MTPRSRRHRRTTVLAALAIVVPMASTLAGAGPAAAVAGNPWTVVGSPVASTITGGPWTLNQGDATYAQVLGQPTSPARYCIGTSSQLSSLTGTITEHVHDNGNGTTSTPATDVMEPYYFPLITSNDGNGNLTGLFDWRPKDNNEAVMEAVSHDNGVTWTTVNSSTGATDVLRYRSTCGTPNSDDDGQGHANAITVNGNTYLYTLDRSAASADILGLTVHSIGAFGDVTGLPHDEPIGGITYGNASGADTSGPLNPGADPSYLGRTTGLINPDGITQVIPGAEAGMPLPDGTTLPTGAVEVAYLEKDLNYFNSNDFANACTNAMVNPNTGNSANQDRTIPRIAWTTDGIHFTDAGPISFTNEFVDDTTSLTATRWLGVNGTFLQYADGTYGYFFSGANCSDGDSDAFHYIGYAHSTGTNPNQFTVDNGFSNPIYSVNYSYPTADLGTPRSYYEGRVYAPQIVPSANGTSAEMIFSGYQYPKPTKITNTGSPNPKESSSGVAEYRTIMSVALTLGSGDPAVNTTAMANYNPGPGTGTPETPSALMLPLAALVIAGGGTAVMIRRRRRIHGMS